MFINLYKSWWNKNNPSHLINSSKRDTHPEPNLHKGSFLSCKYFTITKYTLSSLLQVLFILQRCCFVAAARPVPAGGASFSGNSAASGGSVAHQWIWHTEHWPVLCGNVHTGAALAYANIEDTWVKNKHTLIQVFTRDTTSSLQYFLGHYFSFDSYVLDPSVKPLQPAHCDLVIAASGQETRNSVPLINAHSCLLWVASPVLGLIDQIHSNYSACF